MGQYSIFVSNDDTSNFLCTSPSDTSLKAKRYQDFHQIFSHRHFYRTKLLFAKKKIVFCRFLSVELRVISIFLCTFPIPSTGVLENAKNRFKFGLLCSCALNQSSKSPKCHFSKNRHYYIRLKPKPIKCFIR